MEILNKLPFQQTTTLLKKLCNKLKLSNIKKLDQIVTKFQIFKIISIFIITITVISYFDLFSINCNRYQSMFHLSDIENSYLCNIDLSKYPILANLNLYLLATQATFIGIILATMIAISTIVFQKEPDKNFLFEVFLSHTGFKLIIINGLCLIILISISLLYLDTLNKIYFYIISVLHTLLFLRNTISTGIFINRSISFLDNQKQYKAIKQYCGNSKGRLLSASSYLDYVTSSFIENDKYTNFEFSLNKQIYFIDMFIDINKSYRNDQLTIKIHQILMRSTSKSLSKFNENTFFFSQIQEVILSSIKDNSGKYEYFLDTHLFIKLNEFLSINKYNPTSLERFTNEYLRKSIPKINEKRIYHFLSERILIAILHKNYFLLPLLLKFYIKKIEEDGQKYDNLGNEFLLSILLIDLKFQRSEGRLLENYIQLRILNTSLFNFQIKESNDNIAFKDALSLFKYFYHIAKFPKDSSLRRVYSQNHDDIFGSLHNLYFSLVGNITVYMGVKPSNNFSGIPEITFENSLTEFTRV